MQYTKEMLEQLDKELTLVPLVKDYAFKSVMMKNTEIFKTFLIQTMNLNVKENDSHIILLDKELIKENDNEKGKTVDFNVKIGKNLLITIEVNRYSFDIVKERNQLYLEKLHTMQFEVGEEYKILKSKYLYQLNLNAKDNYKNIGENIIINYDITNHSIYNDNLKIFIKHLAYYKDMFYNKHNSMRFDEIFMAGLMSENFVELYDIMSCILSKERLNQFIGSVVNMSKKYFKLHEWESEKMDKLVMDKAKEIAMKEGHEQGMKEGMEEGREEGMKKGREEGMKEGMKEGIEKEKISTIKTMLANGLEYEMISRISGKTLEEIKNIEESMDGK